MCGGFVGDIIDGVTGVVDDVLDAVGNTVEAVIDNPIGAIVDIGLISMGVPPVYAGAIAGGANAAANGGNILEGALTGGVSSYVGGVAGSAATDAGASSLLSGAAQGASSAATGAILGGGDIGQSILGGGVIGGAGGYYGGVPTGGNTGTVAPVYDWNPTTGTFDLASPGSNFVGPVAPTNVSYDTTTPTTGNVTNLTSTGYSDSAPGTVYGSGSNAQLVLDSGKTVNLQDYQNAINNGGTIAVDNQITTGTTTIESSGLPRSIEQPGKGGDLPPGTELASINENNGAVWDDTLNTYVNKTSGAYFDQASNAWVKPIEQPVNTNLPTVVGGGGVGGGDQTAIGTLPGIIGSAITNADGSVSVTNTDRSVTTTHTDGTVTTTHTDGTVTIGGPGGTDTTVTGPVVPGPGGTDTTVTGPGVNGPGGTDDNVPTVTIVDTRPVTPVIPVPPVVPPPVVEPPVVEPPVVEPPVIVEPPPPEPPPEPPVIVDPEPPVVEPPVVTPPVIPPIPPVVPPVPPVVPPTVITPPTFGTIPKLNPQAGLNPGWIQPTPFYHTTNDVQSQYSWGGHPFQVGPTFNAQLYNQAAAPETPWGLQQMFHTLTPEEFTQAYHGTLQPVAPAQNATRVQAYVPYTQPVAP